MFEPGVQGGVRVAATLIEALGVLTIVTGAGWSLVRFFLQLGSGAAYQGFRSSLGRAILLGLELLVAADIIRTVAVEPSFRSVGVLAIVVMIRTFLSVSLEVEISGRWPWAERPRSS